MISLFWFVPDDSNFSCCYSDRILRTFNEAQITFAPTYKYIPGTENFDEDKQRVPS